MKLIVCTTVSSAVPVVVKSDLSDSVLMVLVLTGVLVISIIFFFVRFCRVFGGFGLLGFA